MSKLFYDTETCGLHGFVVLIQYAIEDGEIELYEVWKRSVNETLRLIEMFMEHEVVGFNLSFDHFQLSKCYTVFSEYARRFPMYSHMPPQLALVVACEEAGRDGLCLKPAASCDLMLWSRKIPKYQTLMNRGDIRIRKVPIDLAYPLADELDGKIELPEIYWARQQDKSVRWRVYEIDEQPHFRDLVLKFNASAGLKYLAEFVLGEKPPFHFDDIAYEVYPKELGFAPTVRAAREHFGPEADTWADVIGGHIEHWSSNENAREYARLDVDYTRKLYYAFRAEVDHDLVGDDDSELACMVAAVRWHGFEVDLTGMQILRDEAQAVVDASPINVNAPAQVRSYLLEVMDPMESILIAESTRKQLLEEISDWDDNDEAAARAKTILNVRKAQKEVELYNKLLLARRFHASFRVIGALSSRMSGADNLNAQGIKSEKKVRQCFTLKWEGMELCGGDFANFEGTIADAVYKDPEFRELITGSRKAGAVFGTLIYPHLTYEEIVASDGMDPDYYTQAKSGYFACLYMGNAFTLHANLGIPMDVAEKAMSDWFKMLPGMRAKIDEIEDAHAAVIQVGPGFQWRDPAEYVENMLGYKRSFEIENRIMKTLFDLAQSPPREWNRKKLTVVRRQKIQTAGGAVRSALYGACFGLQNANIRAAGNHIIQSTGALVCKMVQREIWNLQPSGVHEFQVAPMQVHDEIMTVCKPEVSPKVSEVVNRAITEGRKHVELLGMDWSEGGTDWANTKKGGTVRVTHHFKP